MDSPYTKPITAGDAAVGDHLLLPDGKVRQVTGRTLGRKDGFDRKLNLWFDDGEFEHGDTGQSACLVTDPVAFAQWRAERST